MMDDSLETPTALVEHSFNKEGDNDEQSSGDEYDGPDWTRLSSSSTRPVIPKRGEKDFEPAPGGGSGLQQHVLDRARNAMFDALKATRSSSSKSISYGVWHPNLSRVHVTLARGIHFSVIGHSTPRPQPDDPGKLHKRLELLPEEAIYLIERGSLFCWKKSELVAGGNDETEDIQGAPMSVQQAYSEMIGTEDLTLEKYQVFAHLKRLGYVITRSDPPSSAYPTPPPFSGTSQRRPFLRGLWSLLSRLVVKIFKPLLASFDWWRPLCSNSCLHYGNRYASLFRSLRFIPSARGVPAPPQSSPYKVFFNIYKPSTPFRKTAPPRPDFSIVVVNARTTLMPSYDELCALFDVLPELPPPLLRQRRQMKSAPTTPAPTPPNDRTFLRRIFPWAFLPNRDPIVKRRPNPFIALKAGKKTIVIAAVDIGNISFFRFSQGNFSEWPMM